MELSLYITNDNENVINKILSLKHTTEIKLKETTNISNPVVVLSDIENVDLLKCNYCYLSEFERFYFIRDIEVSKALYVMYLECDVLESFKNDILTSEAEFSRTIKTGDYLNFNSSTDLRKDIDIYESDVSLSGEKNIVFSTIGGAENG